MGAVLPSNLISDIEHAIASRSSETGAMLRQITDLFLVHAGHYSGDQLSVYDDVLEMLVDKNYIPVISPVGLGADGTSYNINADHVAAEIAVAAKASKLIFLTDVAGILDENGQLLSELTTTDLRGRLQDGKAVKGGMAVKSKAVLRALEGGVSAVHVVDGREPHSVVVELFTDKGVGTLVKP